LLDNLVARASRIVAGKITFLARLQAVGVAAEVSGRIWPRHLGRMRERNGTDTGRKGKDHPDERPPYGKPLQRSEHTMRQLPHDCNDHQCRFPSRSTGPAVQQQQRSSVAILAQHSPSLNLPDPFRQTTTTGKVSGPLPTYKEGLGRKTVGVPLMREIAHCIKKWLVHSAELNEPTCVAPLVSF
jgi:hypothetical protein